MKKKVIGFAVGILVAVCFVYVYRAGVDKNSVSEIIGSNGCIACHSFEPEAPFYASWHFLGKGIRDDMHRAARFVTFDPVDSTVATIDEIKLAKIEQAVISGSMPPSSYRILHPWCTFSVSERDMLSDWIKEMRRTRFNDGLSAGDLVYEPIRPIPDFIPVDKARVILGRSMFNDTRISLDNTISCATCHILEKGGADHADERTSEGIDGLKGTVNSPTIYNACFQVRQFWNGRASDLAEQAAQPPVNSVEMGDQSWDEIVSRLREDRTLVEEFERLYPGEGLTRHSVCDAIAEYEKTLITPDAPFDRYLKGDGKALTEAELDGYRSFRSHDCSTCHSGLLVGGGSFEYLGIAREDYFENRDTSIVYSVDDDGLKGFTGCERDLHRFKVPSLRNVALTPPYLHDGTALTMEQAVEYMMIYQTGEEPDSLQIAGIVLFLNTLTGVNPALETPLQPFRNN